MAAARRRGERGARGRWAADDPLVRFSVFSDVLAAHGRHPRFDRSAYWTLPNACWAEVGATNASERYNLCSSVYATTLDPTTPSPERLPIIEAYDDHPLIGHRSAIRSPRRRTGRHHRVSGRGSEHDQRPVPHADAVLLPRPGALQRAHGLSSGARPALPSASCNTSSRAGRRSGASSRATSTSSS